MSFLQNIDPQTLQAISAVVESGAKLGTGVAQFVASKEQAKQAEKRAKLARADERRKGRRLAGRQRALFAKAGVRIDEGSPIDVLAQTARDSEINALRAAIQFEQQADNLRSAGKIGLTTGILGSASTLLTAK